MDFKKISTICKLMKLFYLCISNLKKWKKINIKIFNAFQFTVKTLLYFVQGQGRKEGRMEWVEQLIANIGQGFHRESSAEEDKVSQNAGEQHSGRPDVFPAN